MVDAVLTIPAAVARAARVFGDGEAIADGATRLTYRQLHDRVRTVARFFIAQGVRPGDRVAVWAPNTHHWVLAALGAQYAGATLVPINTRYTGYEALDILQRTGARALVVAGPFLGTDRLAAVREAAGPDGLPELRSVLRVPADGGPPGTDDVVEWADLDAVAATVSDDAVEARAAAVAAGDLSEILFTSGTTGRSKGVMS